MSLLMCCRLTTTLVCALSAFAITRPSAAQVVGPIVLYASDVTVESGLFLRAASTSGAAGMKMTSPDTGWDSIAGPLPQPVHYFEATFVAPAGVPYRTWLRLRAAADSKWNDSVWVQFDQALDSRGVATWRTGSSSALLVNLEDCIGCGVSGWGWQDNASWLGESATVQFASSGPQTIRVQLREDGVDVDQIVLLPALDAAPSPGTTRNDTTIVPKPTGTSLPSQTLTRQPFLQQVTDTSARVVFATAGEGRAAVRVVDRAGLTREVAAATTFVASTLSGGAAYYQHEAAIEGLAPTSRYHYVPLVDGGDLTPGQDSFTTAPPVGEGTVRFLALGDSGVGSTAQRQLAARMAGETFDLLLHTGDVAYGDPGGWGAGALPQLQRWFFDVYRHLLRTHPVYPSIGNHDDEAGRASAYLSAFVLPANGADSTFPDHAERYYSFDYGPAHVVVLDTELAFQDANRRAAQVAWLGRDLASTRQPWKIAVFHRAPYSAGGHHGSNIDVQSTFEPVFATHGVQVVLSGHEHAYERTRPQRQAPGGLGITYIVTGGGGAALYPAGTAEWTAASASVFHYMRGQVDPCHLELEAIGIDGVVFDRVLLERCGSPFQGTAAMVPGLIEAEAFDLGGEGVAYHDLSDENEGDVLRPEAVDVEPTTDTGGGYNVGWLWPGEWLSYTVYVATPGVYEVSARVSSPGTGGTFELSIDGLTADGTFAVPATGGWQRWQTVRGARAMLGRGWHRLRFTMLEARVEGGAIGNVNYFSVQPVTTP